MFCLRFDSLQRFPRSFNYKRTFPGFSGFLLILVPVRSKLARDYWLFPSFLLLRFTGSFQDHSGLFRIQDFHQDGRTPSTWALNLAGIIFGMKIQGRILEDRRRICKDFFRGLFFSKLFVSLQDFFLSIWKSLRLCFSVERDYSDWKSWIEMDWRYSILGCPTFMNY